MGGLKYLAVWLACLWLAAPAAAQELLFRGTFEAEGSTPVAGAVVELRAADGTVKAIASTNAWGVFPAFPASQLAAGDSIVVFGGNWLEEPFVGEFRTPVDGAAAPQIVGPIPTLVDAVASSALVTDAPPGRLANAVSLLTTRGLVDANWRTGSPARVSEAVTAHIRATGGLQTWLADLLTDLADAELDRAWMVSFPHVHGGVAGIEFPATAGEWLRGESFDLTLEVERTLPVPAAGFSFSKQQGPDWVSVSATGLLSANVPADAPSGSGMLLIRVTNPDGGRFRDVPLSYQVLVGTVVAQASYGAQGGTLWIPGNTLGLQVPDNAFSAATGVEWVRYGEGQAVTHRFRTNPRNRPFLIAPTLLTPPATAPEATTDCSGIDGWGSGWFAKTCDSAKFAEVWVNAGTRPFRVIERNRLPQAAAYTCPADGSYSVDIRNQTAWVLGARCNGDCAGRIPVLFVHGYTAGGDIGGGIGTWGDLPELLHGQAVGGTTLAAYQFRYRSNARFQDLAADLQRAIDAIHQETQQPVHIVAHSFGGLLSRTYLQGLIPGTPALAPQPANCTTSRHPKVASLVTVGTPHSGVAAMATVLHGVRLPDGRHDLPGALIRTCRQSSCWQAGAAEPFQNAGQFRSIYGLEAEPGFIPARLSGFGTANPLPVPTLSLIGLMPSGNGFDDGDNLISYQGQRFSPRQSCPAGTCSSSAVLQPAITNIEGTQLGHCVYERVLGTVINNAAPLPGASTRRVQTLLQTYAHFGLAGGGIVGTPQVEVRSERVEGRDLKLSDHDTAQRLQDWLLRLREPDPGERVIRVEVSGAGRVELDFAGSIQSCVSNCVYRAPTQVPAQIRIRAVSSGGPLIGLTPSPCGTPLEWCTWRVGPYERISATFQGNSQGLLRVQASGAGRVRVQPGTAMCTGICNYYFSPLDSVTLTAEGAGGSFQGWSGNCSGTQPGCTLSVNLSQPRVVTANFTAAPPVTSRRLNDTGQNWCANNTTGNLGCPQSGFPDQDGDHGRDAQARAGTLVKIGGGEAGFDYTKISNSGNPLPASAALGSGPNDWGCTRDNVTGLIWEVKTNNPTSLRHMNHTYTWYSTDANVNGGNPGSLGTATTCNNTLSQCNTQAYVAAVNAQGLCGANNWRMPTPQELQGIVHYGRSFPAIDRVYFVNTSNSGNAQYIWTGRSWAAVASAAQLVHFVRGDVSVGNKADFVIGVRLVRAVP